MPMNSRAVGIAAAVATIAIWTAFIVVARAMANGFPADLIPETLTSVSISVDRDAENELRTAVLDFMDAVRIAERAIAKNHGATEHGAPTGPEVWRRFWTP